MRGLQSTRLSPGSRPTTLSSAEIYDRPICNCEATTVRTNNAEEGAMKRDTENETPEARNLSRREVLGLIGATAAASLAGGPGEQPASAQEASAPAQNMKSRIVRLDAKLEPIAIDTARTAVIVCDMQNDFGTAGGMFNRAGLDISMIRGAVGPTAA